MQSGVSARCTQDKGLGNLVGTWQDRIAGKPVNYYCYTDVVGRHLQQATNANEAYVQVQIAILTSGSMATSLQLQLMADVAGPLLNALQLNGLAVTSITLDSLDVQEVRVCLFACIVSCSCAHSHCNGLTNHCSYSAALYCRA